MSENKDVTQSQPEPVLAAVIDWETLSVEDDAVLPSVGIVFGDLVTRHIRHTLYIEFNVQEQIHAGRRIDASTLAFWLKQNDKARLDLASQMDNSAKLPTLAEGMALVKAFLARLPKGTRVVGNGPTFDLSIILAQTGKANSPYPFWEERSLRDWRDICQLLTGVDVAKQRKFEGIKHNALDDARHEFFLMADALDLMRGYTADRLMREMPIMTLDVTEEQQAELKELIADNMAGATMQLMPVETAIVEIKAEAVAPPLFVEYRQADIPAGFPNSYEIFKHFDFISTCVMRGDMAEIVNAQSGYDLIQSLPEFRWPTWVFNGEESAPFNKRYALRLANAREWDKCDTVLIFEAWNEASILRWMDQKFGLAELSEESGLRLVEIATPDFDYSELTKDDEAKPGSDDGAAGVAE